MKASIFGLSLFGIMLTTLLLFNSMITIDKRLIEANSDLGGNKYTEIKIRQLEELSSKKLSDQIQKREILAENKIEQLIRDANLNIKNYISSIAIETTINILKNNLTVDKKTDLINESIKELNTTLKV